MRYLLTGIMLLSLNAYANSIEGLWLNITNMESLGISCADYGDIYAEINDKMQVVFKKDTDTCLYEVSDISKLAQVNEVALLAPSPISCYFAGGATLENYSNATLNLTYTSWNFKGDGALCYFQLTQ